MPLIMTWWMWFLLGLVLMALEVLTPGGFFIMFFGTGAVAAGVIELMGIALPLPAQVLVFVGVSIVSLVLFRKPLQERFARDTPQTKVDSLIGEAAKALNEIPAGGRGMVELRGASWTAENLGTQVIAVSQRCRVERVEGLTLFVRS